MFQSDRVRAAFGPVPGDCAVRTDRGADLHRCRVAAHVADPLGLDPWMSVATLRDLGLSNAEIARYFSVDRQRIDALMQGAPA